MSYRETLQTAIVPIDSSLDEEIAGVTAVVVHRVPDTLCPSGVAIALMVETISTTDGGYLRWDVWVFDAADGSFCGRFVASDTIFHLSTSSISEMPNTTYDSASKTVGGTLMLIRSGVAYGFEMPISPDPDVGTYDRTSYALWPGTGGYWDGDNIVGSGFLWNPVLDIAMFQSGSQGRVVTYTASTGAKLIEIPVAGDLAGLAHMNPPYALAFSRNNNVTQFNYVSGQVMSVGKLPDYDVARGAGVGERVWGYDRYNHRILLADWTNLDLDGLETTIVRGFSPIPQAHSIVQPITNRKPQTNRNVKIFTRVIGAAGEGIGAQTVDFVDQAVGDVSPSSVVTGREGYAIGNYDGLTTGGAETITVNTNQPESAFSGSVDQGAGSGNQWEPTIHLDFNGQGVNDDLSGLITQQVHWDQVTGYGAYGDQIIVRPVKSSSAELRIQSADDGIAAPSFGGDLVMDLVSAQVVPDKGHLWVGAWVYFPTGFDFTTTSNGLRLFQIRDNFEIFGGADSDIVVEVRLKHGGGTTHTGYEMIWPNQTVTETKHNFAADSSVLTVADTWHFIQYYIGVRTNGPDAIQRLWIDDLIVWELVDDAAQYRDTGGAGALTPFTAAESIPTSQSIWTKADELRVFRDWEGGAPSDQTCYVGNVFWTRDTANLLPRDENDNRYISKTFAENF